MFYRYDNKENFSFNTGKGQNLIFDVTDHQIEIKLPIKNVLAENRELKARNDKLEERNDALEERNGELVDRNDELEAENDELVDRNDELEAKNNELVKKIAELELKSLYGKITPLQVTDCDWMETVEKSLSYVLDSPIPKLSAASLKPANSYFDSDKFESGYRE